MTDANARTAANLILMSAGIGVAYVILSKPPLRRLALRAAEIWLGASVPVFLLNQTRQAWAESGKHA
jgi:hypothetical protein